MTRFRLLALFASLFLLLGGAVACGGDDDDGGSGGDSTESDNGIAPSRTAVQRDEPSDEKDDPSSTQGLTLAEYFAEVDAIFEEADSATDDAQAELETLPDTASLDEQKEAIDTFLSDIIDIFRTAEQSLQDLVVPVEAGQPNSDFMSAIDDAADLAADLQEQAADASTQADLDDLVNAFDADVSAATADADAACLELQALATSNNIDVDLDCED